MDLDLHLIQIHFRFKTNTMKRKIDEALHSVSETLSLTKSEIKKKLRSVQEFAERECYFPNQLISFLSGSTIFNLHDKYSSSSMQEEKQLLARYEAHLYQMFPKSSCELSSIRMMCLHGTCKVSGSYSLAFHIPDPGDPLDPLDLHDPHDQDLRDSGDLLNPEDLPLLDGPFRLSQEELQELNWSLAKMTVQQYHLNTTDVQLFWKKPMTQISPQEERAAQLLRDDVKTWDLKLDDRELQSMNYSLVTHLFYHRPPVQSFEQRGTHNQRFLKAQIEHTFIFSYLIFFGEPTRERYQLLLRQSLARIVDSQDPANANFR